MSTTSLFIELLIIGLEVSIWLILFVASITGTTWLLNFAKRYAPYAALVTGVAIGVAYLLGIIVDKFAHYLVGEDRIDRFIKDANVETGSERTRRYRQIYARIIVEKGQPASDVLYGRSKVRILRSSVLNIPLITITGVCFLIAHYEGLYWWVVAVLGTFFTALAVKGYLDTLYLYRRRLEHFKQFLEEES